MARGYTVEAMTGEKSGFRVPGGGRHWAIWILGALAFAWTLSFIWWLLLEPTSADAAETPEFVIPEGTAAAVANGQPPPFIPTSFQFGRDRRLIVRNLDVVEHTVGD